MGGGERGWVVGKRAGIGLALPQLWRPWPGHPGLFPAQCLSLRVHTWGGHGGSAVLGRAAGCTLLALARVTLLALAQAPGKWGGEGHSCPPSSMQNIPSLCEYGPDGNEAGPSLPPTPAVIQG